MTIPGLRYGNAEIVLDYIVRRPDTGGSFGTDLSQGVNAMWGNYNVFGKVNHKNQSSVFLTTWGLVISTVCTGIMKKHSA